MSNRIGNVSFGRRAAYHARRLSSHSAHLLPWIRENAKIAFGGGFIALLCLVAILAPVLAPHDPLDQDLLAATLPPVGFSGSDPAYSLGTDGLGRDVLSRLIFGSRVALSVAVIAAALAALAGTVLGLLAGFFRTADLMISRLIEIWMAFPPVLLSILVVAILGSGVHSVVASIAIVDWTRFARVIRADAMAQEQADYVTAARTAGFNEMSILFRDVLPNVLPILLALFSLEMGIAVIVEAILSFVGYSVSSDMPTWGGMIAEGRQIVYHAWWVFAAPLAMLFLTVLAFNVLGEGLRQALDPVLSR